MGTVNFKQIKTAQRYALALSKFDTREVIYDELCSVWDVFKNSPDLKEFLQSPVVTAVDKKDVLSKVFGSLSENTLSFLMLLTDKNRFDCFDTILSEFKLLLDKINNVTRVEIVSAVELTEDEKRLLCEKLENKLKGAVEPEYKLDESILAGLVVRIGDKVVDNSLKTRFESLKRQLI